MIMTETLVVIEKHIIFMVHRWQEPYHGVKDLLILKTFYNHDRLMREHNATFPLGLAIM
jgi:hypothetical protein